MLAPICLFTYNRLNETQQTITALQQSFLAEESDLIIYSDGGKDEASWEKVYVIREYLKTLNGFKTIHIIESPINKGLANSIISGVTKILEEYGKVIVLEDDLITTPNFLNYMNQCLDLYAEEKIIFSVCGYGLKIKKPVNYLLDVYLYGRSSSWGWGTWKDRWQSVDWEVKDWNEFKNNRKAVKAFNRNGSDMFKMLKSVTEGEAQSWAIRFGYAQFKQNRYSIMPFESFVENIGFTGDGTNTKFKYSRFVIQKIDENKISFNIEKGLKANKEILKSCYSYHSIAIRIYSRIRYLIG